MDSSENEISTINEFPIGSIVFGKYEILSFIASGGNGHVYKVLDTHRKIEVALKVLPLESFDDKQLIRFQAEAQTAAKLRHSNIATVYDFGLFDGTPYLIMEYVEGLSLEQMLDGHKRLDLPVFLDLFIQITEAVIHAHNNGIIHRDLKPGNVVIHEDANGTKTAKILDFGVAKRLETNAEKSGKQTPTGNIVGSPLYMSPEQARGIKVSPESDFYSIGAMMFRCLAGHPPLRADTSIETIMKVANIPAPSLSAQPNVDVADELIELVDGLLSKDPTQRPSLENDVLSTLRNLRSPETNEAIEDNTEGTISDTTLLLTKTQQGGKAIILTLVVAIIGVLAMLMQFTNRQNEQPHMQVKYSDVGGLPSDDAATELRNGTVIDARGKDINDEKLDQIEDPDGVLKVRAGRSNVCTLATISRFKRLLELEISNTYITDSALERLTELKSLHRLDIGKTEITDLGMRAIGKLGTLTELELTQMPKVTATGIRELNKLKSLKHLILQRNLFTRADVEKFASAIAPHCLINLRHCDGISRSDLDKLKSKFPDLVFNPGSTSVVYDLALPIHEVLSKPVRSTADYIKARDGYRNIIAVVENAYGKKTPRSREYFVFMANADSAIGDPKSSAVRRIAACQTALEKNRTENDPRFELSAQESLAAALLQLKGYQAGKTATLRTIAIADSLNEGVTDLQASRYSP